MTTLIVDFGIGPTIAVTGKWVRYKRTEEWILDLTASVTVERLYWDENDECYKLTTQYAYSLLEILREKGKLLFVPQTEVKSVLGATLPHIPDEGVFE